jgi:hypothetical protein
VEKVYGLDKRNVKNKKKELKDIWKKIKKDEK